MATFESSPGVDSANSQNSANLPSILGNSRNYLFLEFHGTVYKYIHPVVHLVHQNESLDATQTSEGRYCIVPRPRAN